ncbi:hypothetical protein DMENIID0001_155410 [Sergentomyia squamirostris]
MGRKNRHSLIQAQKGAKGKAESSAGGSKKGALNKTKKGKNVFKVNTKNKAKKAVSNIKKAKGGKKEALEKKSDKLNETLKTLHQDMVVKKPPQPKASPAKGRKGQKNKKGAAKTKDVEAGLSNLGV